MAETPQRDDGDISPAPSKAESTNMDLYINPAAERKMMLKFDVRLFCFPLLPRHVKFYQHLTSQ